TVTIAHSIVTGNRAIAPGSVPSVKALCPLGPCPASFGDAAGIDDWGSLTLVDTTVSANEASGAQSNGGGIVAESGATLTLLGSTVERNTANAAAPDGRFASGGGIFVDRGAALVLRGSVVRANAATLSTRIPAPYPRQGGGDNQSNA